MRRLMLTAAVAALLLMAGAAGAAASRSINLEPTGANRASGTLTFSSPEVEFLNWRCRFTLTLAEVRGGAKNTATVLANVTGSTATECEGATVRLLAPEARAPWSMTYVSFAGTLPRITSVRLEIRGFGYLTAVLATNCLYGGNPQFTTVGSPITSLRGDERVNIPLVRDLGSFPACPRQGNFSGSLSLERAITMRLA